MSTLATLDALVHLVETDSRELYVRWSRGPAVDLRGSDVRPWVLVGKETDRGPDNEPLVTCQEPVAWVGRRAIEEAERLVDSAHSAEWGPLDRR